MTEPLDTSGWERENRRIAELEGQLRAWPRDERGRYTNRKALDAVVAELTDLEEG